MAHAAFASDLTLRILNEFSQSPDEDSGLTALRACQACVRVLMQ